MLSGIPNLPKPSVQSSGNENSVSESENSENFSQHLGANSNGKPKPELSDSIDTTELPPPSTRLDGTMGKHSDTTVLDEEHADADIDLKSVKQQPEFLDTQKTLHQLRFSQLPKNQELKMPWLNDDGLMQVTTTEVAQQSGKTVSTPRITAASELPVLSSQVPTAPDQPSPPSNIVTASEQLVSSPEVARAPAELVLTSEIVTAFELLMPKSRTSPELAKRVSTPDSATLSELQVPSSQYSNEPEMQLSRSEITNRMELQVPTSEVSHVTESLIPTSEISNVSEILVPPSEVADELVQTNTNSPVSIQNLNGGERNIFNMVGQTVTLSGGFVKDSKAVGKNNTKLNSISAINLQTPVEGKATTTVQNSSVQHELPIQTNIVLPQERSSANDTDLEKAFQSIDLKTPAASPTIDSSSQKPSVDVHVPSLSQPSQTLVRAIQENSNWTKVLSSSSVRLDQTTKVDGTVLQKLDIHLNLAALGKLDVKLRLQQGELQVQIRTDSEQAYKMLSVDQDALANTIKGLGYKVDNIAISGPRSDSGFQMNSNSQMQGQHQSAENHYQNEKSGQRANREFIPMRDADNDIQSQSPIVEHSAAGVDVI